MVINSLLSQADMNENLSARLQQDEWKLEAYTQFATIMEEKSFPCLFGRSAFASGSCLYAFVSQDKDKQQFTEVLHLYTSRIKSVPLKNRLFNPVVIFFEAYKDASLSTQQAYAWKMLQAAHDLDPLDWPEHLPTDTEHYLWTYQFNHVELFFNMCFPQHVEMKSRNLGNYIVFVINSRDVFDVVANGSEKRGVKIREQIRARAATYNDGFISKVLGAFKHLNNKEWKQYQLEEPGSLEVSKCPLKIIKSKICGN